MYTYIGAVPSTYPHITSSMSAPYPGLSDYGLLLKYICILLVTNLFSIDIIDIDKIMDAIPDMSDLMTVLDGIKDDVHKWHDLFGKRLLKDVKK